MSANASRRLRRARLACVVVAGLAAAVARPQSPGPPPSEPAGRDYRSPNQAYEAGDWQQALDGFVALQVEHPDEPALMMNIGSAHYRLGDLESAALSFATAAAAADPDDERDLRADAYYNLGNTSYRQGKLEEAVEHYQASLDLDPDDLDAKHNLELVRREIRRREEEARRRQQEQGEEQEESRDQSSQAEGGESGGEPEDGPVPDAAGPDRDQDGLPDRVEEEGANPTDPDEPDSDGDGLRDGVEDRNQNGRVDEGETDPNKADSDGDGVPDSQEVGAPQSGDDPPQAGLSEVEAARLLEALEEGRPRRRVPASRRSPEKDW
ncbi:MAG: tetratricopeptide repeat protein [Thermoanaerobaculia bacterium]|nr:tetratricopeptide repeat protein [Thermoanaerobaculia bacterium]